MKKKIAIGLLVVAVMASLVLSWLAYSQKNSGENSAADKAAATQKTEAETSMFGTVEATDIYTVFSPSAGKVSNVNLLNGQEVKKQETLLQITTGEESNDVSAKTEGVITKLLVSDGQPIQEGQALLEIADDSKQRIVVDADEVDVKDIRVGDLVDIELDSQPSEEYEGKIEYISSVGENRQNATYYKFYVSFNPNKNVLLGMSATVFTR